MQWSYLPYFCRHVRITNPKRSKAFSFPLGEEGQVPRRIVVDRPPSEVDRRHVFLFCLPRVPRMSGTSPELRFLRLSD